MIAPGIRCRELLCDVERDRERPIRIGEGRCAASCRTDRDGIRAGRRSRVGNTGAAAAPAARAQSDREASEDHNHAKQSDGALARARGKNNSEQAGEQKRIDKATAAKGTPHFSRRAGSCQGDCNGSGVGWLATVWQSTRDLGGRQVGTARARIRQRNCCGRAGIGADNKARCAGAAHANLHLRFSACCDREGGAVRGGECVRFRGRRDSQADSGSGFRRCQRSDRDG